MAAFGRKRTLKTLAFCQRECPLSGKADIGLPEIFRLLDRVKYFLAALFQRKYYRVSFDSMLANQLLSGVRQNALAFWTPKAGRRAENRPKAIRVNLSGRATNHKWGQTPFFMLCAKG
jgi:hypothetical protein